MSKAPKTKQKTKKKQKKKQKKNDFSKDVERTAAYLPLRLLLRENYRFQIGATLKKNNLLPFGAKVFL